MRAVLVLSFVLSLVCLSCGRDRPTSMGPAAGDAGTTPVVGGDLIAPTESFLREVTTTLAAPEFAGREEGSPGGIAARNYLIGKLTECGVEPAGVSGYEQPITTGQGANILGRITGTDPALNNRHIIVSAHYDHLGEHAGAVYFGADDNAAADSITLGVACALVAAPLARSVLVAFWDAEEPPTFLSNRMGSRFYTDNPVVPLEDTDVAIAMDLVGSGLWPGYNGHFVLGSESSAQVAEAVANATVPVGLALNAAGIHLPEQTAFGLQPWSDYDPFRNKSVPFIFLSNGQTKRYHQPTDEVSTLDFPKMALQAEWLLNLVELLGTSAVTPTFDPTGANDLNDARMVVNVLTEATKPGAMDSLGVSTSAMGSISGDLRAAESVLMRLESGGPATGSDISALRRGVQRLMCLAGSSYAESTCALL